MPIFDVLTVLPMIELVEVAEGVLEPLDHLGTHPDRFLCENRSWNMFQMFIFKNIIGTCCTPQVELVEVAEGVLEPSDHLGAYLDHCLFEIPAN